MSLAGPKDLAIPLMAQVQHGHPSFPLLGSQPGLLDVHPVAVPNRLPRSVGKPVTSKGAVLA